MKNLINKAFYLIAAAFIFTSTVLAPQAAAKRSDLIYSYSIRIPAAIDLSYNYNGDEDPVYDATYEITYTGVAKDKAIIFETDDYEVSSDENSYTVNNYLGDKELKSHKFIGETLNNKDEVYTVECYSSLPAGGVAQGNYEGVACFKFKLVNKEEIGKGNK